MLCQFCCVDEIDEGAGKQVTCVSCGEMLDACEDCHKHYSSPICYDCKKDSERDSERDD